MPTNLNALIRYKKIDECLKNPYIRCTIKKLQETCTDAIGDSRGIYKLISERTIRDDIRVMRSNILEFNAPIEVANGVYYYKDREFSIFNTQIAEEELLRDIFKLLLKERKSINNEKIGPLLTKISTIIGEPFEIEKESLSIVSHDLPDTADESETDSELEEDVNIIRTSNKVKPFEDILYKIIVNKSEESLISWDEILSVV